MKKTIFAAVAVVLVSVLFCSCGSNVRHYSSQIDGTNLLILHDVHVEYDDFGEDNMNYWSLIDSQGNVLLKDYFSNWGCPIQSSKGIVLIPGKGVFDCRDGRMDSISIPYERAENLEEQWRTTNVISSKYSEDVVLILQLRGNWGYHCVGTHCYKYNLKTRRLSELKKYDEDPRYTL